MPAPFDTQTVSSPARTHRVVNPEKAEWCACSSMPMFLHPRPEVALTKSTTAEGFLEERWRGIGLKP